jgi:DNA replication protein DnaC
MAACIANAAIERGRTALYQTAPALFRMLTEHRMRAFRDDAYSDAAFRSAREADLLVIDDLGTESMTDARYSEFIGLLNERVAGYGPGGARATIISTNMTLQSLRGLYDERIASRIMGEFRIVHFIGDDLRLRRRPQH